MSLTITDQNGNTVTTTATVDGNGDYSVADVDVSSLTDGALTIDAQATDNNGETVEATDNAALDATPPNPPVITNITDDSAGSDYSDVTLHGTGEPGAIITLYSKEGSTTNGNDTNPNGYVRVATEVEVDGDGFWTLDITDLDNTPVNDNEFFKAIQTDEAGNASEDSNIVHYWHGNGANVNTETGDDYVLTGAGNDTVNIITDDANDQLVIDGGAANDKAIFNASADSLSFSKDSNGYVIVENSDTGDRVELRDFELINIDGDEKTIDELFTPTVTITEDANNDGVISSDELDGQVDVNVDLPAGAVAGDTISVSDGTTTNDIVLADTDISNGSVATSFDAPAEGETLTVTAVLEDQHDNTSEPGSDSAVYLASDGLTVSASLSEPSADSHPADALIKYAEEHEGSPSGEYDEIVDDQSHKVETQGGNDLIIGGTSDGSYHFVANNGDDVMVSRNAGAATTYTGNNGHDTVYLQGNFADYTVVQQTSHNLFLSNDLHNGASHDLYQIETIYFADGKYSYENGELTKVADIVQLDVDVTLNDNDGSERITSVIISGMPEGGSVPDGEQLDSGDWQVPIDALQTSPGFSVTLELPEGGAPDLSVTVGAAEVDDQGNLVDDEIKDTASPLNVILPNEVTSNVSQPLTLTNDDGIAGYNNSFGYYVKDDEGNPTIGKVVWANASNANKDATFDLDGYAQGEIGFFIIPDGGSENAISDQANVTFEQNQYGNWQAVVNGQPLSGKGAPALFDQADLNPDGDSYMKTDDNGDLRFEDVLGGVGWFNKFSFDDVKVNAEWGDQVTTVTGTIGDDVLEASQGNDILIGGTGSDKFQWSLDDMPSSADGDGTDTDVIVDFDNQGDTQDTLAFVEDLTDLIKDAQVSISLQTSESGDTEATLTIGLDADHDSQMDQQINIESLSVVTNGGQQEVVINTLIGGQEGELRLTENDDNAELSVGDSQDLEIKVDTADW
ncbi:hypothetical protein [Salinivibrio sp. AR640]|uniref:hypothetical protein n=1 Tax=Salinivibrio sp. AR640 TaxID=1909437 RepID=UPI001300E7FF|nr:hypothetical protein [Salinivibrio sp. AR640]